MFSTEITTNMEGPKKSFDEISLARLLCHGNRKSKPGRIWQIYNCVQCPN